MAWKGKHPKPVQGGSTVVDSATNGNIVVDGSELVVYTHPATHTIDEIVNLKTTLDNKAALTHTHAELHTHANKSILDRLGISTGNILTIDGKEIATGGSGGGGTADGYGEKLIAKYVHSGNKELKIASLDGPTCVATLTEPHGLTIGSRTEILFNIIGWDIGAPFADMRAIPSEWIRTGSGSGARLYVEAIDSTKVKVCKSDGTILAVNPADSTNSAMNINKFQMEIPISWEIGNMAPMKRMRIRTFGYVTAPNYRYFQITGTAGDNTTYTPGPWSINAIAAIPTSATTHGVFCHQDQVFDVRSQQIFWDYDNSWTGRQNSMSGLAWYTLRETARLTKDSEKPLKGITSIKCDRYPNIANGAIIEIYDMGAM